MTGKITVREVPIDDEIRDESIITQLARITAKSNEKLTAEQVWNMLRLRFEFLMDSKEILELYNSKQYRILLPVGEKDVRRKKVRNLYFKYMRSKNSA